jgi:cytochrome oxidase assembly protein ShyY1
VLTAAAVLLGLWQLGVWEEHRHAQANTLVHAQPRWLGSVMSADAAYPANAVGQPVKLGGVWLPADTFYVSGRHLHGQRGYWAVTPVAACAAHGPLPTGTSTADCARSPAVLVVRGWTRAPADAPRPPRGRVQLAGWLQPAEGTGAIDSNPRDDVVPQLQVAAAIQRVKQDLYGGYVIARAAPGVTTGSGGLQKVAPPTAPKPSVFTGLRNLLYACQWWVFGGFAVFLWWRWCRDVVTRVSAEESTAEEAPNAEVPSST